MSPVSTRARLTWFLCYRRRPLTGHWLRISITLRLTRCSSITPPMTKVGFTRGRLESRGMQRLLVANRGEIALRIFRAARDLGIATVAVVAPDDRGSLHARIADAVVEIASYLDLAEHVRAARKSGAD